MNNFFISFLINSKLLSFEPSFTIIISYLIYKDEKNLLIFLMQVIDTFLHLYTGKTKDKNISFKGLFDDKGIKS